VIGVLSGFRVMKGHCLVVEAATRLASETRPFHLVFAGQGPFEAAIRQAVEKAGLSERVSFLGFVQDTAGLLAALDIALYPPLESDGMSRALFEYLAAGRAVVASRVGVAAEVLTGRPGCRCSSRAVTLLSSPPPWPGSWNDRRCAPSWDRPPPGSRMAGSPAPGSPRSSSITTADCSPAE